MLPEQLGWPNWAGHEVATAVLADPVHLVGARGAVRALIGADAGVG